MQEDNEYLVLMTACIKPSQNSSVVRSDPLVRLEDYKNSLKFWLGLEDKCIRNILFIENSGHPLDSLEKLYEEHNCYQKTCEFVSLGPIEVPFGLHYGYAELKMIDEGLARSKLFSEVKFKKIIKVTGRLIFPAISKLIRCLPKDFNIAVDTRCNIELYFTHRRPHVTTQLIIFSVDFYRQFLYGICDQMTQPNLSLVETLLYVKLMPLREHPGVILRWPCNAEPLGIAGNGKSYGKLQQTIIKAARAGLRVIWPNWWL